MKILIIGLGSIGKKHVRAIRELEAGAEIYAVRHSPEAESFEAVENIFSLDGIDFSPDFVIISNPTNRHREAVKSVMRFDCPLFIEKPVFDNLENTENLLAEIEEKNILTYVACNLRFHGCIAFLKNYLAENDVRLNEVNGYCGSYLPDWRPDADFRKIYSANEAEGGGVHLDLIHELDYLYWLFGTPQKASAFKRSNSSLAISAADYANYALLYEDFAASVILNYYRRSPKRSCELVFEDKTWFVDLLKNKITENGNVIFSSDETIADTYVSQMRYFLDCLKSNEKPMNSIFEAVEVLQIALS